MKTDNPDIFDINLTDFDSRVLEASHKQPVLVDFWAKWCSPCIVIAPMLKKIIKEFEGQVLLAKLEVDEGENMKLAGRFQTRGFPTIILFRNGEEQERFAGAKPMHFIREFIGRHI
ncbi:MAG: thioredoxin fold domain-containing protein [Gammaproteobacteria bacterium]|nr:thioredoxin fold domain-containing protein [Gammaproteobacteria bacterium]